MTVPAGPFLMGAGDDVAFAYDNERPRHAVDVAAFRIARRPVTNATWLHFAEGGGYERREWWSDEGWAWKEEYDITHDRGVAAGDPDAPACHVSWFEADAFARAHGARLPTEAEWEKAATWTQGTNGSRGSLGASARCGSGRRRAFGGYPGFVAHPYREYSEVFFGDGYRVLRGGSWATDPPRGHRHLPQLGPPPAPADLLRRATGQGGLTHGPDDHPRGRRGAVLPRPGRRALARRRRPRRPDAAVQGDPPKHFYDARGGDLFDRICELPEYYPTRAERTILETRGAEAVVETGTVELVELGSGTATKTRILLRAMHDAGTLRRYVPIDVTEGLVRATAEELVDELPGPVASTASSATSSAISATCRRRSTARASSRSSAGRSATSRPAAAARFLRRLARLLRPGTADRLLLGTDLVKDVGRSRPPTTTARASPPSSTATCCG